MVVGIVALASMIIIGIIDLITGYELNFFVFYFIPVSITAWYIGLPTSVGMSVLCAMVWFVVDIQSGKCIHCLSMAVGTLWYALFLSLRLEVHYPK